MKGRILKDDLAEHKGPFVLTHDTTHPQGRLKQRIADLCKGGKIIFNNKKS
jgi:hypothetical protein